jgi:UPF0755 protein
MSKKKWFVFKVLGVSSLAFLCGIILIWRYFNDPPALAAVNTESVRVERGIGSGSGEVTMEIADGESAGSVGGRLLEARLIKGRFLWDALCRVDRQFLNAGTYRFEEKLPLSAIRRVFITGKQLLVSVTVPEGQTIKKTAAIFEDAGICAADDFIAAARDRTLLDEYGIRGVTMEGYLYPDTYRVNKNYPAAKLIRMMADNFYAHLEQAGIAIGDWTSDELFRNVILASIIEREYRIEQEAPVMAGVFFNRLSRGMRLESCATVEYIITEIEGKPHPRRIFNRDLEIKNPYNTYIYSGLPPGPVSSPGKTALAAVFFPDKNDYLFFRIIDPAQGRHYFSRAFDDHIRAGQLIVKGR